MTRNINWIFLDGFFFFWCFFTLTCILCNNIAYLSDDNVMFFFFFQTRLLIFFFLYVIVSRQIRQARRYRNKIGFLIYFIFNILTNQKSAIFLRYYTPQCVCIYFTHMYTYRFSIFSPVYNRYIRGYFRLRGGRNKKR